LAQPLPALNNFVQDISTRLFNNLVIKASHKQGLSTAISNQSNRNVHPARDADTFDALQSKSDSLHSRPQQTGDQPIVSVETSTLDIAVIVRGTKEKKLFLTHMKNILVKILATQ
jgi:hypothetical protein